MSLEFVYYQTEFSSADIHCGGKGSVPPAPCIVKLQCSLLRGYVSSQCMDWITIKVWIACGFGRAIGVVQEELLYSKLLYDVKQLPAKAAAGQVKKVCSQ